MGKVAVVMGSISDFDTVKKCLDTLSAFGVEYEARVISAHRTPQLAAGKAAHLGGVLAAFTTLPVIGLPVKSSTMDGMDSLLSMVQMPSGVPVACVAINGAENAALLALQMLALGDEKLEDKLAEHKNKMQQSVASAQQKLDALLSEK